jgi:hypothetical protein
VGNLSNEIGRPTPFLAGVFAFRRILPRQRRSTRRFVIRSSLLPNLLVARPVSVPLSVLPTKHLFSHVRTGPVRVGIEATGSMQWFLELMEELGVPGWTPGGDPRLRTTQAEERSPRCAVAVAVAGG